MKKIKAFLTGFDYAITNHQKIEDHHFHSLPGAAWHDKDSQLFYRNGIKYARKYINYRYELLALCVIVFTTLLFMFTW